MEHYARLDVHEGTQIGSARRQAVRMAEAIGMDASSVGNIAIVVTELATNLQRYAREGQMLLHCSESGGFEAISIDRGPGMDVQRCLQDGYSTGGTPGNGLGAVRRLSTNFDIYSSSGQGSVVWTNITRSSSNSAAASPFQFAGISLPAPGEIECGDAWAAHADQRGFRIVVADGLGHGPEAARAGAGVVEQFRQPSSAWCPKLFLERTHTALAGTRGAAAAAGHILNESNRFTFAGVGNISATILTPQTSKGLMSHNGTLGARIRTVQVLEYEWPRDGYLVMHTDGLMTRWDQANYPGILNRHPAILAAALVRDYTRGRDDVTAVIIRRR